MQNPRQLAEQYANDDHLRVRFETHQRYGTGPGLEPAVDRALALVGEESLLDVGTGPGDFPGRLRAGRHRGRLVGLDLSAGMLEQARASHPGVEFVEGSATALPFPDESFDVVTARHMLYHVPDVPGALGQFRRVLKPGGRFLAVTNAEGYLGEYWAAVAEAVGDDPEFADLEPAHSSFSDVIGLPLVRAAFGAARVEFLESELVFPDPEPVLAYFHSGRTMRGFSESAYERAGKALRRVLGSRFQDGPWRVSRRVALVTARR